MRNILFIGNSYTFFSDMPEVIFAPMANAAGYECTVTSLTHGGYYLSQFADPTNEEGIRLRELIRGRHYDAVILQDNSTGPIRRREEFLTAVGDLIALFGDGADRFVLYATWGRHPDSPDLSWIGMDSEAMTAALSDAYNEAARRYSIEVAEVGNAFAARRAADPAAELYDPDRTHPSAEGSRLAAETILQVLLH